MENVKVTLVKSLIACKKNQILTANTLGLKKPGDVYTGAKNAALEGKLKVIAHLVKVETV